MDKEKRILLQVLGAFLSLGLAVGCLLLLAYIGWGAVSSFWLHLVRLVLILVGMRLFVHGASVLFLGKLSE